MTVATVHHRRAPPWYDSREMTRVLVVVALTLGSVAGLGGCGGSPLTVKGGHGGATGGAGAIAGPSGGAGAAGSGVAPGVDAGVAPMSDASSAGATGGHGGAPSGVDAASGHAGGTSVVDASAAGAGADAKDASLADATTKETTPSGWLTFDVTATIALTPPAGQATAWAGFPTTVRFPMEWSRARGVVVVANGGSTQVTPAGGGFRVTDTVFVYTPFAGSCEGIASLDLNSLTFSVGADGVLHGQAEGDVTAQMGESVSDAQAAFTLVGGPDVTPPTIDPVGGMVDPLYLFSPVFSEPMAPGGSMALVGATSGDRIPFSPSFLDDNDPTGPIVGFSFATQVMLRWGEVYKVEATGVKDLAGNAFAPSATETTPAPPPLQPEDGFEAVTGTTYAGGGVLKGGPLAPIAGTTSLLVGDVDTFLSYEVGATLTVRLAVAPGDTVVRFDTRLVAPNQPDDSSGAFRGIMFVGAVGKELQATADVIGDTFTMVSLAGGATVWQSGVGAVEIPLPDGATGEVSLEIMQEPVGPPGCGLPVQTIVMLVDNVRVE